MQNIKCKILSAVIIAGFIIAAPALAAHDPNTTDADCPATWVPQYGVVCSDANKPEACGVTGGIPQCIATASLPSGTCNNGSVRVNCDSCTASCVCSVSSNIVCSGGSPATFGTCQPPLSCVLAGRVTANSCTGACGGCASGFEDLTPATTNDACTPIRPKVTLAPPDGFPDADTTVDSSLYINKTGSTGNLARLQRGGADRVIVTNNGQLVLGLASDWNTFTQTLGAEENLIYGAVLSNSSAQSNVLLFQRAEQSVDIPPLTLLRLDTFGNLTVNGNVTVGGTLTVTGTINSMDPANILTGLTGGSAGGLTITGIGHTRALSLLSTCASGQALLWNAATSAWACGTAGLTQESDPVHTAWLNAPSLATLTVTNNLTVGGAITGATVNASGCFGPVFQGVDQNAASNGGVGGYNSANDRCASYGAGAHVCSTAEILESIRCGKRSNPNQAPIFSILGFAWISNGPPGFTANANDCMGWTDGTGLDGEGGPPTYGAVWQFSVTGGRGFLAQCNEPNRFTCCQ